jgi:hypothetical protein
MLQRFWNTTKILKDFMSKNFRSLMKTSNSNLKVKRNFKKLQPKKYLSTTEKRSF